MKVIKQSRLSFLFKENMLLYVLIVCLGGLLAYQVYQTRFMLATFDTSLPIAPTLIGERVPDVSLQDLSGVNYSLSDPQSDYTLLILLHTECEYCQRDMPLWRLMTEKGKENNVRVLGVTMEIDTDMLSNYAEDNEIAFPILIDPEGELFAAVLVDGTPTKVLLSTEREVLQIWHGWTTRSSAENSLGALRMVFGIYPYEVPEYWN